MRLARAMKRKAMRSAQIGEKKGRQDYSRAKKAVRHATTREIVMQAMIRKEFAAEITATVFVAMRRSFGWGTDRLMRLRKKMGMELDCLTDKYVKIEDLERIIRDELAWGFDIEDASDLDMESRTKYRTIRVMSAAFIVALHDEFGFGQKRAMRAYESLRRIWKDAHEGKMSMADIWAEYDCIGKRMVAKELGV